MDLTAGKPFVAALLALLAASTAIAQLGDEVPHPSYYAASQAIYAGDYRVAARELARETQRGIHTPQTRWIDSICYYAMYGEILYHQGRTAEALAQFDEACQILLAYPNWMLQVRFQHNPRVDANRARRVPTWGRSQRTFVIGQFSGTESVLVGDLDANRTFQTGGVYRAPMLLRVNVVEIIRMSALAIRRRNEILGPLAAHDPINKQVSAALAAGNLSPANHWSSAWIDLLRGLAQLGAGKIDEADNLLGRSLVIDGQFDHPLTGVALMEQGHIATIRGDTRRATQLFAEAGYSAFYFEDYDVLTESALAGWLNHVASGAKGVYPPLDPIATWAQTNRLQHVATKLRLAQAESLLWLNQVAAGASLVDDVARRIGDMRTGLPGVHLLYVQAALQIVQGRFDQGGEALARTALAAQAAVSLRNFQIARTNTMYDSRAASARVALDLYTALLADPSSADWLRNPVDAMAVVGTGHDAAFDRWFLAALERKEPPLALEVAERAKRRRYLATQPFGGRLLALRAILESPEMDLTRDGLTQRQQYLASFPAYRTLAAAGNQTYLQLQAGTVLPAAAADSKPLNALYDQWDHNASERQHILVQLSVRRLPSSLEFPPMRSTSDLQKSLSDGEALAEFHAVGDNVYGFLVTKSGVNIWQLPDAHRLRTGLGNFLRALGNYGPNREFSVAELKAGTWRDAAKETYKGIFNNSHLDEAKISSLAIVPDNLLWYLPFEALIPSGAGKGNKTFADMFPIRYGPTAALAVSNPRPLRRPQHTGILASDLKFAGEPADRETALQELVNAVTGPLVLPDPLKEPARLLSPLLDGLIVLDDIPGDTLGEPSYLFPKSRGASKANAWITLPYGGPERLIITGFKTEAQQGMKTARRETSRSSAARKPAALAGDDIFQSLCNLMSTGTRSILLTRWRTGGRTNFDLVREFAKESADAPPAEAWQRACLLARENPIDPSHEPRLKRSEETGDMPKADHPFFWAGYLLVDTGPGPPKPENADAAKDAAAKDKKIPPPAKPGEAGDKLPPPKNEKEPAADKKQENAAAEGVAPPKVDEPKPEKTKSDKE